MCRASAVGLAWPREGKIRWLGSELQSSELVARRGNNEVDSMAQVSQCGEFRERIRHGRVHVFGK